MPDHQIQHNSQVFSPAEWLRVHLMEAARAMFPNGPMPDNFEATPYVHSYERIVLKMEAGEKATIIKAFNPEHPSAMQAHYREAAVLANVNRRKLVPDILHHSSSGKWIMSVFIEGAQLEDLINADTVVAYARDLGEWYARYTDILDLQASEETSTWLAYLGNYEVIRDTGLKPSEESFLASLPIRRRLVAKNDANLCNFLVTDRAELLGIDFEKAALKPYGYDILSTARILVQLYPHLMLDITGAIVDGFGRGTDVMSQDQLLALTRLFSSLTAFNVTGEIQTRNAARLRAYNARAELPAMDIVETPMTAIRMSQQDPQATRRLTAYLEAAIEEEARAAESGSAAATPRVKHDNEGALYAERDPRAAAFCGTCQGSCCRLGASRMAFLRPDTLRRTQQDLGLEALSDAIRYYSDLLPARHVEGSCFFHTESGCAIPRRHRSDSCNSYRCLALKRFHAALGQNEDDAPVLIFNSEADVVQNARLVQKDVVKVVDPAVFHEVDEKHTAQ